MKISSAAALAALAGTLAAPASGAPCTQAVRVHPAARGDTVRVLREDGACVVAVGHRRGIGAARLSAPAPGDGLLLRFSGFAELEGLTLTSPAGALVCELHRPEGAVPEGHCRLNGAAVTGPRRTESGFELAVPPALMPAPGEPIEVRWTDFWR